MSLVNIPILIVSYNRPDHLRRLINALRPLSPTSLFLATDGPNPHYPNDAAKVAANRATLASEIDWPCRTHNLHFSSNQGCRVAVSRSISWFFEHVTEGIILEDDCLPNSDFFPFCSILLERYRHDLRVWAISGSNFQQGRWRGDGSYYFSRYSHCWGWATWRDRWQFYDGDLIHWPVLRDSGLLDTIFENPIERDYWSSIFERLLSHGKPDSWAYRWTLTCFMNSGLIALPNHNLVQNIGFGPNATHTFSSHNPASDTRSLSIIRNPSFVLRNIQADQFTFDNVFHVQHPSFGRRFFAKAKLIMKSFQGRIKPLYPS